MEMIWDGLYYAVLIDPAREGCDELRILSGYATAAMVRQHVAALRDLSLNVAVRLIVGMVAADGISQPNHEGFCSLRNELGDASFACSYVETEPVHSKVYVWARDGFPKIAFCGSANYTQTGFLRPATCEAIAAADPAKADDLVTAVRPRVRDCLDPIWARYVQDGPSARSKHGWHSGRSTSTRAVSLAAKPGMCCELPLVTRTGQVHWHAGLNWGQRRGREKGQAYLPVPAPIARSGFFPPRAVRFYVRTDDGTLLWCSVAQDGDKAIHTPDDNSILGRYFRKRLGVSQGAPVTLAHLTRYGRTSVTFCKISDEEFVMDFSPPAPRQRIRQP